MPPPIAAPADEPYPGPVQLEVDVTNVRDRVAHVREEVPVAPNAKELVLLYPQWIPGNHSPTGPISRIAGTVTAVDGTRVQWVRDPVNVYAFHVPLRAGARTVALQFDYLSPIKQAEGRIERSDAILDLQWNEVVMYPAGYFSRDIPFDVALKLPQGWKYATALETASAEGSTLKFKRTTLNTLRRADASRGPGDTIAPYDWMKSEPNTPLSSPTRAFTLPEAFDVRLYFRHPQALAIDSAAVRLTVADRRAVGRHR